MVIYCVSLDFVLFYVFTRHRNRVLVNSKATRNVLKRICTDVSAVDVNELNSLRSELHQSIPSLASFLGWCLETYGNETPFPAAISKFIKDISCNTPVCAIFPPCEELRRVCDNILRSVPIKEFPHDMEILQQKCPSLFGFFLSLNESLAPGELIPLLTELLTLPDNAFQDYVPPPDDSVLSLSSFLSHFPYHQFVIGEHIPQTEVVDLPKNRAQLRSQEDILLFFLVYF